MCIATRVDELRTQLTAKPARVPSLDGARLVPTSAGNVRALIRQGRGEAVVLLADPPLGLEHYLPLIDALAAERTVVAFEVPGFGFSPACKGFDYALESYAGVIGDVLGAFFVRRAILAPACFGGLPALRFALDQPERVLGFVGVQAPSWADAKAWMQRNDPTGGLFATPVAGQLLNWVASAAMERGWLARAEPNRARRAELQRIAAERRAAGSLYCLASGLQATRRPDPFVGARLACPSAIVWGGSDRSHAPTSPRSFGVYLTAPTVHELPLAGHFPEVTSPATLVGAVRALGVG